MSQSYPIDQWLWEHTDQFGKRRVTRYRLTEGEALAQLKDPIKIESSFYRITGPAESTSSWQKRS